MGCGSDLRTQASPVICPSCGTPGIPGSRFCEGCGKKLVPEEVSTATAIGGRPPWPDDVAEDQSGFAKRAVARGKLFWAGVLLMIAGIAEIANGIVSFNMEIPANDLGVDLSGTVACCATLVIFFGIIAVLGGLVSIYRKNFYMALIASIVGILGGGWYLTSSLMSLIAMIVIAFSMDDFES